MEKSSFNVHRVILLLSVSFLIGCHVDNAKVVETKKTTIKCVVGKWVPENQEQELKTLEFNAADSEGGETGGLIILLDGVEISKGTWSYHDIGEIEMSTPDNPLHFKLLNCKRAILDNLTIYMKE